jgi:hypothetical protein
VSEVAGVSAQPGVGESDQRRASLDAAKACNELAVADVEPVGSRVDLLQVLLLAGI